MEKVKHNHCLTEILKVCLFSLLMIAPLLASVSQMLYVTLNKNAKDSYAVGNIISLKQINSTNDLIQNEQYTFEYNDLGDNGSTNTYYYNEISINWNDYTQTLVDNVKGFRISTYTGGTNAIFLYDVDGNELSRINNKWGSNITGFNFTYQVHNGSTGINIGKSKILHIVYLNQTLDNAFYYGVNQMTQSELFNWTQNTGIYTGVHAMTNGIGIESVFIPILLTYWLVLTIVYIIIDVVIETFKYLTHMLQNKVKSKTS